MWLVTRTLALAWFCNGCESSARRIQADNEKLQGISQKDHRRSKEIVDLKSLRSKGRADFSASLATFTSILKQLGDVESIGTLSASTLDKARAETAFISAEQRLASEDEAGNEMCIKSPEALPTDVVVKIHGTGVSPSYLQPWQVLSQRSWTGTGFLIDGRRILTNAHVVEDETVLQVQKQDNPKKFRARVLCVAHDLDLAIIAVEEEGFWDDMPHADFAQALPDLYSEVKAVGFPTGGATVCVTKGIVSRVDAQVYVHPRSLGLYAGAKNAAEVLVLQIDAAINPGNSGGPAFDNDGKVVGIASSGLPGQQNVGYIIPSSVAQMFIAEFKATGKWSGISEPGFAWKSLESVDMRELLGMGNETGVLVVDVAPLGVLRDKLQLGDIITHIDDLDITNEGNIPVLASGQKVFLDLNAQITKKAKGEKTELRILRKGEFMQIEACLGPIPSLAPRFHGYDAQPDYIVIGGLVFTRGSVPLKKQYYGRDAHQRPPMDFEWMMRVRPFKEDVDQEVVVLLSILEHDVNVGYGSSDLGVLKTFNEKKVKNLAELARLYGEAMRLGEDDFLRFSMDEPDDIKTSVDGIPDIVLSRKKVEAADQELCQTYQISDVVSAAMRPYFLGEV